jgi:hypothetical protein
MLDHSWSCVSPTLVSRSLTAVRLRLKHDKTCSADALQGCPLMLDTPAHEGVERGRAAVQGGIVGLILAVAQELWIIAAAVAFWRQS